MTVTSPLPARPDTAWMRLRDRALAGAVLAGDEDVGLRRPDALDDLEHRAHRRRGGDEQRTGVGLERAVLRLEPLLPSQRARQLDLRAQDREHPRVLPRLLHEVPRAAAHGLDGQIHAAPGGHHHDRQRRIVLADLRQQIQPLLPGRRVARVVEIHQDGVEVARLDGVEDGGR